MIGMRWVCFAVKIILAVCLKLFIIKWEDSKYDMRSYHL